VDRVFLDANVLFSASYRDGNRLLELWNLSDAELVASALAVSEALRNSATEMQRERLSKLLVSIRIVSEPSPDSFLPQGVTLPAKDAPILLAAIQAGSTHLLTGDKRHFGPLYGQVIEGVLVQRPSAYLLARGV
jgi:predicted nucleic acid-binding protein